MVVIRLSRVGKKNSPAYRVVVADKQRAVKRKYIEVLGHYNPTLKPKEIVINSERAQFWIARGAKPSDTVTNLMVDLGILAKDQKIKKIYAKKNKKKAGDETETKEAIAETAAEEAPAESELVEAEPAVVEETAAVAETSKGEEEVASE